MRLLSTNSMVSPREPVVKRLEAEPVLQPTGLDPVTLKLATLFDEV